MFCYARYANATLACCVDAVLSQVRKKKRKAWKIGRRPGRTECVFGGQEHEKGNRVATK